MTLGIFCGVTEKLGVLVVAEVDREILHSPELCKLQLRSAIACQTWRPSVLQVAAYDDKKKW